jgi:hypothetical protein
MTRPTTLHPRKQLLFALLSAADFGLTWWLLGQPDGRAYEANPVANFWLARFGWLGLACFKAAVVCVVLGLASAISRSRPLAGGRVLQLGCACLAVVVAYSSALAAHPADDPDLAPGGAFEAHLAELNRRTAEEERDRGRFRERLLQLSGDVAAERCSLYEAAEELRDSFGGDASVLRILAMRYPDSSVPQRFACCVFSHAVNGLGNDSAAARALAHRLSHEFQSGYGALPPRQLCLRLGEMASDRD